RANHATLDGRHLTAVFTELWEIYTQLVNGVPVTAEPGTLPESNHALMRDRFNGMIGISPAKPDDFGELPDYTIFQHVIELDQRQSSIVLRAARGRGLTVHALLCSIVIETQLSTLVDTSESVTCTCWSPVDLRNRVTPPVGATETTNFLAMHRTDITYTSSTPWYEIGLKLQKDLKAALNDKRLGLSGGTLTVDSAIDRAPANGRSLDPHLGAVSVSNYGTLPTLPTPGDMRITKFHSIADRLGTPYPNFSAFTMDGSLSVISRYRSDHYTQDEVKLLVKNTTARLLDDSKLLAP
ncbi:phthiocerol/phthiodiolone dimycocerosyl transferase family protein, partial [Amycolatopsis pithecellobii]